MLATAQSLIEPGMKSLVLPSDFLSNFMSRPSSQAVIASFVSRSIRSHVVFFACSIAESLASAAVIRFGREVHAGGLGERFEIRLLCSRLVGAAEGHDGERLRCLYGDAGEREDGECGALGFD